MTGSKYRDSIKHGLSTYLVIGSSMVQHRKVLINISILLLRHQNHQIADIALEVVGGSGSVHQGAVLPGMHLHLNIPDHTMLIWESAGHQNQSPLTPQIVIVLHDTHIANLNVSPFCVPLSSDQQCRKVQLGPDSPKLSCD